MIDHVTEDNLDAKRHAREQLDRLTDREREVAQSTGLGKSNAKISI